MLPQHSILSSGTITHAHAHPPCHPYPLQCTNMSCLYLPPYPPNPCHPCPPPTHTQVSSCTCCCRGAPPLRGCGIMTCWSGWLPHLAPTSGRGPGPASHPQPRWGKGRGDQSEVLGCIGGGVRSLVCISLMPPPAARPTRSHTASDVTLHTRVCVVTPLPPPQTGVCQPHDGA
jgi:hypothetical protein